MFLSDQQLIAAFMIDSATTPHSADTDALELVPPRNAQGYNAESVEMRRRWTEQRTNTSLPNIAASSIPAQEMRGNIENAIGSVQMPLGIAGPLKILGEYASGTVYVPLATTEGALVRSYERGMLITARAGGVTTRILMDENCLVPVFRFRSLANAAGFSQWVDRKVDEIRGVAESTTSHGRLLKLECRVVGRDVYVRFRYSTGDAHGMNMIMKATDTACRWIAEQREDLVDFHITSGMSSEKRAAGVLLEGGKGKRVVAEAIVPASVLRSYLRVTPASMLDMWHRTMIGQFHANTTGYNGHIANGLTAMFIACGQDVANVANSAVGLTIFDITTDGDLYLSVTLPSLSVATVGGGTALGTSRECLEVLDCYGTGKARRLAEIVAATVLCGELSMGAAIASGEFSNAHELYGRNRPETESPAVDSVPQEIIG